MADEQMPKPEGEGEDKESGKDEKGKKMENGAMDALMGGIVGLILGNNNNGGGILGGGNNADRFATTDALIQASAGVTQRQISDSTFALSSQACNNANALSTQIAQGFCSLEAGQQKILCAVEAVGARVALSEERILGNQRLLSVEAENAALKAKLAEQQNVNVSGNLDVVVASAVSRMVPQIAQAVRAA